MTLYDWYERFIVIDVCVGKVNTHPHTHNFFWPHYLQNVIIYESILLNSKWILTGPKCVKSNQSGMW